MPDPEILFEDAHLIVLSKPAGLLSQGEHKGDPNLVDWLRVRLNRQYVGLVHRLDRNTSGIMVVAKRTKSAQRLTSALQDGKICRAYLAWVLGSVPEPVRWVHRLLKDETKNVVRVVSANNPQGREAVLNAKPLARGEWEGQVLTLLEITLETGRSHQIRVQAAHEGVPLLGDKKYPGKGVVVRFVEEFQRPALHSFRLSFPHPMSGEVMSFEAALPADMAAITRRN